MSRVNWPSKAAADIVRFAKENGFRAGLSQKGHLRFFDEAGRVVMHTGARLSPRNLHNARAQIKRAVKHKKEHEQ